MPERERALSQEGWARCMVNEPRENDLANVKEAVCSRVGKRVVHSLADNTSI